MRIIVISLMLVLLTGCISHGDVAQRAAEYNLAHEEVNSKILLLNVVRAMHRRPMVYSGLTSNTESIANTIGTGSISLPFGGDAANEFSVSPSVTRPFGPLVTMAVYNDNKFFNGILKPVEMVTLDRYLKQGWDPEDLLMLAVQSIEVSKSKDGPVARERYEDFNKSISLLQYRRYENEEDASACGFPDTPEGNTLNNTPGNAEQFNLFREFIRKMASHNVRIGSSPSAGDAYSITLDIDEVDPQGIAAMLAQGAEVSADSRVLTFSKPKASSPGILLDCKLADGQSIELTLRSPQSILYYLGELARAKSKNKPPLAMAADLPFILNSVSLKQSKITRRVLNDESSIGVAYEEVFYYVDDSDYGNDSTQALSLLTQLFGLHHSNDKLPGAQVVNLVPR